MTRELSTQVLVVNRHLQAVHITTARRAFILLWASGWALADGVALDVECGAGEGPLAVTGGAQAASEIMPATQIRRIAGGSLLRNLATPASRRNPAPN